MRKWGVGPNEQRRSSPPLKKAGQQVNEHSENSQAAKNKIEIAIISDTMCDWCFVGTRNLQMALSDMPDCDSEINFIPYVLNKDLPDEGMPVEEYFLRNYGNPNGFESMKPGLIQAGRRSGINFEKNHG